MPWLDDAPPMKPAARKWKTFLKSAFIRRFSTERLAGHLQELAARFPVTSSDVAVVILSFRAQHMGGDDPLLFGYAHILIVNRHTTTAHLLHALLSTSSLAKKSPSDGVANTYTGLPSCEERMFNMLTRMHVSGPLTTRPIDIHDTVHALTRWMQTLSAYEVAKQLDPEPTLATDLYALGMYEAVASLSITFFGGQAFKDATQQEWWQKRRDVVVNEMQNFDTHVLLWSHSQLAGRLQAMTTLPPFIKTDGEGRPVFTNEQILSSIAALQMEHTRAGLFVWLEACLCARPLTDDLSMLNYLQARYPGNNQSLAVDIVVASFDVLTNGLRRKEADNQIHVVKSFICNKVPHLLSIVSGFLTTAMSIEDCISMAFTAITMNALPPITEGATELTERLKLTRLEFLQASALHGLVSENTISSIIQEPPISLPRINRYTKEGLAAQCVNNIGRLEPLIDELDGMLGNAAAIAGCIVEVINSLCNSKDTMSLKSVCNMVLKRVAVLDNIMQYCQPPEVLRPLCTQLNDWVHDQDQTEFTPAYEEFASILLFVLAARYRYDLKTVDLGIANSDNFVADLLQNIAVSKPLSDLTEEQSQQLGKWSDGLFATDEAGETGGISDEVMRHCPPQAFYQLVPTLFEQTVFARKTNAFAMKTINGGLELLVEPFLLPSLVGGLSWLIQHSWEDHGDMNILLQVLDKLLKPSSSSQETKTMHRAILGIIANPLYQSLRTLNQRQPEKKQVVQLLGLLKPYINQQRVLGPGKLEIESWVAGMNVDLAGTCRRAIRDLTTWVSDVGLSASPKYGHKLLLFGCTVLGPSRMLDAIIAELKEQTSIGRGSMALDICAALVCAPQVSAGTATLHDALRLRASDLQALLHASASDVESIVRLDRRVEAQLAVPTIAQIPMAIPTMPDQEAADQVMAELGLADGALPAANAEDVSLDAATTLASATVADFDNAVLNTAIDQGINVNVAPGQELIGMGVDASVMSGDVNNIFGDIDLDMTQASQQMLDPSGANVTLGMEGQQSAEDDIFAGLDMSMEDDFNFA